LLPFPHSAPFRTFRGLRPSGRPIYRTQCNARFAQGKALFSEKRKKPRSRFGQLNAALARWSISGSVCNYVRAFVFCWLQVASWHADSYTLIATGSSLLHSAEFYHRNPTEIGITTVCTSLW